jgi:hypothetical protein
MLHKKWQKYMKFEELDPRQHYKLECNNLKFWCEILYLHFGHESPATSSTPDKWE